MEIKSGMDGKGWRWRENAGLTGGQTTFGGHKKENAGVEFKSGMALQGGRKSDSACVDAAGILSPRPP